MFTIYERLNNHDYPLDSQLRVAAHEMFHPPFDLDDEGMWDALSDLKDDAWVQAIIEESNPAYGYSSFEGIVNEGSAQALDQIVAERLGFAQDPGERWRSADGGMHMLAAAFYHALKEEEFEKTGGEYAQWLMSALERGLLRPDSVRQRAAEIVGDQAVQRWGVGIVFPKAE
jgi:hypothetical protein